MVVDTHHHLGRLINALANCLTKNGCAAQAGHRLCGVTAYPLLEQRARLGWHGGHRMLITREFGARSELAVIYTNIHNLPVTDKDEHEWLQDSCPKSCECIKM
jgi:arsenite methyltransferase